MPTKVYIKITAIFLVFLLFGLIINSIIFSEHKKELYESNNRIVANLLKLHPELENEVIKILNNEDKVDNVLKKYGFKNYDDIEYLANETKYNNQVFMYNAVYILAVIIVMYLIIFQQNRKFKKEITNINRYMNKVLNGNYSIDIRDYSETKLSLLKNDIYKLVVKLKEQREKEVKDKFFLKDFLSDISHQLKTPLTSMYVINDILEKEKNKEKRTEFLNKNKLQLERIEWLISSLLKMSLLDSGTVELKREQVNIKKLLDKALEPINIPVELKNISLKIIGNEDLEYYLDFNWTVEAILNILKNAYEYTKVNGNINIYYNLNPLYLMIKISDDGVGIKKEEIKNIFKRFYKINPDKGGIGIGLNMAHKIIDKQNGEIIVRSIEGSGTTFEIRFYNKII